MGTMANPRTWRTLRFGIPRFGIPRFGIPWLGIPRFGALAMPCLCTAWLSAAWLGAALLLACCGSAMAQQAEEEGFARSLDRPVSLPDPLQNPVDLRRGIQFGAGIHNVRVKSEALAVEFERKDSFSDGGSLHVD